MIVVSDAHQEETRRAQWNPKKFKLRDGILLTLLYAVVVAAVARLPSSSPVRVQFISWILWLLSRAVAHQESELRHEFRCFTTTEVHDSSATLVQPCPQSASNLNGGSTTPCRGFC